LKACCAAWGRLLATDWGRLLLLAMLVLLALLVLMLLVLVLVVLVVSFMLVVVVSFVCTLLAFVCTLVSFVCMLLAFVCTLLPFVCNLWVAAFVCMVVRMVCMMVIHFLRTEVVLRIMQDVAVIRMALWVLALCPRALPAVVLVHKVVEPLTRILIVMPAVSGGCLRDAWWLLDGITEPWKFVNLLLRRFRRLKV